MITIGIPFYNDEHFLDFAIQSVFNQTYTDWKLILISDGGTDGSLSIARSYEKDPRVTIISDGENRKLPYRLNQIAQLSTTKYLARMDADDIMHPERIEKQLEILQKNPDIDVLGTNAYSIDDENNIQGVRMDMNNGNYKLKVCSSFIHPSIIGRTKWFKENPYDEKAIRVEDYELWQRTKDKSVFIVWTEPLLYYREFGCNYYKKYLNSIKSKFYVAKKLSKISIYANTFKTLLVAILYYLASLIGKEDVLIGKRMLTLTNNEIELASKNLIID